MSRHLGRTDLWDIYELADGQHINILRPELSVALVASRFTIKVETNASPPSAADPPAPNGAPTNQSSCQPPGSHHQQPDRESDSRTIS